MTQYWEGGTSHFFLLILYKFKNIGGHMHPPGPPYSAVPVLHANTTVDWTATTVARVNAELASCQL